MNVGAKPIAKKQSQNQNEKNKNYIVQYEKCFVCKDQVMRRTCINGSYYRPKEKNHVSILIEAETG